MIKGVDCIICEICHQHPVSSFLGVCAQCIRSGDGSIREMLHQSFRKSRAVFPHIPTIVPHTEGGLLCNLCAHECQIGPGQTGFCGVRKNLNGKMVGPTATQAFLHAYYDQNPTNCCAAWYCPAGTGCGYPSYVRTLAGEKSTLNLSVFFYGCNFNCLYCQNDSHKRDLPRILLTSIDLIVSRAMDSNTTCVCYFGGSPEPHFPFALNLSKQILHHRPEIKRICWEWNGAGHPALVQQAAIYSLKSGGTIKFDLKAFHPSIAEALLGIAPNVLQRVYSNFTLVADLQKHRPAVPLVSGCTLLVPYYIDHIEVEQIAQFIAAIDPSIPYSLLVFHPSLFLRDLPITPLPQVIRCFHAAKKYLQNVHVGNLHLLGFSSMQDVLSLNIDGK